MDELNPNGLKVGDTILVEQAWEDEMGNYHDESAEVEAIDSEDGSLTLKFPNQEVNDFLRDAEFLARDYRPE